MNDVIQALPLLDDVFNAIGLGQDLDELVDRAAGRTISAAALAHFWDQGNHCSIASLGEGAWHRLRAPGVP